ncbi:hypothetical protein [Desertimonas flava]|uniref:hypothetical protein n=1 Tax=Desertimonas flava TaxID=2064846 RepID=UPI0013C4F576|nr:hypothetical protein [Desertimonas flava]
MRTRTVRLDGATKPMCLVAVDQGLVDHLSLIVHHLGGTFNVAADEIPEPWRDLYESVMASAIVEETEG